MIKAIIFEQSRPLRSCAPPLSAVPLTACLVGIGKIVFFVGHAWVSLGPRFGRAAMGQGGWFRHRYYFIVP